MNRETNESDKTAEFDSQLKGLDGRNCLAANNAI